MIHRLLRARCHTRSGQRFKAGAQNYEFLGSLGNGATGIVRKARDLATSEIVAVKILAPDPKYINVAAFDDVEQRFKREGTRGAHLQHPNLVKIVAYEDNEDGRCFEDRAVKNPFIVMEYIAGRTLESLIKKIGVPAELRATHVTAQTLSIARSVSEALVYLHERKIIHRDVKPANIFISSSVIGSTPSLIKLGDFGITKWGDFLATAASGTLTVTRQEGLGTLKYMSPEQAVRPRDVSVRSDMFSLGITLFELFTGQILQSPHHVFEIMSARTSRESIFGKMIALKVRCPGDEIGLFEMILDMFLAAPKSRPTSVTVAGRMEFLLERLYQND